MPPSAPSTLSTGELDAAGAAGPAPAGSMLAAPGLEAAVRDGMWWAVMWGAGESYLMALGVFLGASNVQVGLLATLPPLLGALSQVAGVRMMDRFRSRRSFIVAGAACQSLAWLPIASLPLLVPAGGRATWLLMALAIWYHVAGSVVAPVWNSLIGDMVPADWRGRYFGRRNYLIGICNFLSLIGAGVLLDAAAGMGRAAWGYATIAAVALGARVQSVRWLARYDDPPFERSPGIRFGFLRFLLKIPSTDFGRFVAFMAAMNFGVSLLGPYLTPYMLRDLKLSYLEFTVISSAMTLTQFLVMRHWGALSDRFGNRKVMAVCAWGIGLIPLLWVVSGNVVYLAVIQTYSGLAWAGFNLACASYVFDAVPPSGRARCAAYYSIVNASAVLAGSFAGGQIATWVDALRTSGGWDLGGIPPLLPLVLLSASVRWLAAGLFLPRVRELRSVEPIRNRDLFFRIIRIRPGTGATYELYGSPSSRR